MNGSHGCAPRTGRAWLGSALAAAGLFAASAPEAARACHISNPHHTAAGQSTTTPPASASAVTPTSAMMAPTPTESFQQALDNFLKDWQQTVPGTHPAIGMPMTHATSPAAEMLAPSTSTPTVANQNTTLPCGCPTPPPPCPSQAPANTTTVTPPAPQTLLPSSSSAGATATPEPSTILSALAMVGAVAWRRRATRSRV